MNIRDIRICFMGDSFTNGTEDKTHLSWTGRLCTQLQSDKIHITHYNLGVRKDTSENIKQRWESECSHRLPNHSENIIIFCFGTNDTYIENGRQLTATKNSIENARLILSSAKEKYKTLMVGPIPMDDAEHNVRLTKLDIEFQQVCKTIEVPYLSVCHTLLAESVWTQGVVNNPGNHADAEGYTFLTGLINKWIIKNKFLD